MRVRTARPRVLSLMREAAERGDLHRDGGRWCVDWSGACGDPVTLELQGQPVTTNERTKGNLYLDARVRCRKCGECLRHRARAWADRIAWEIRDAARSWFITLTTSMETDERLAKAAGHGSLSFEDLHSEISREITKLFKRLRRDGGPDGRPARFRYVLVAEVHGGNGPKRGRPHYHLVLHDDPEAPLRVAYTTVWDRYGNSHQVIRSAVHQEWSGYGFVDMQDIATFDSNPEKAAWYVASYLAKDARARVRASIRYGQAEPVNEVLSAVRSDTLDTPTSSRSDGTSVDRGPTTDPGCAGTATTPNRAAEAEAGLVRSGEEDLGCLITQLLTEQGLRSTVAGG